MDHNQAIRQVKEIILKHANPERIYLFGSYATGDETDGSDIDIAYDDKNFKDHYHIENEVQAIDTLMKIDIKNIAFTQDRFKNRVKSTGKVIYSATKSLRAEDALLSFTRAFERFSNVVNRQDEFKQEGFDDIYLDLIVKRFEFTYEMSWKALKRYLDHLGISVKSPRETFKEAYAQQLILDESIWLNMIEQRNLSSHVYDEYQIKGILNKMLDYETAFSDVIQKIENGLSGEHSGKSV